MSKLNLRLLGSPSVTVAGEEVVGFTSAKVQALLVYLAVTQDTHRRSSLAALLWPNTSEQKAHMSLRNALATLRRLLPEYLEVGRHSVALRLNCLWLDTYQFSLLLKRTEDPINDMRQRQAAVSLYAGEFLAGFHVPDATPFEHWATILREQFHQQMVGALMELAHWAAARHDDTAGLDHLTHLLTLEPGSESAHRMKMRVLARMGQRSAAILQFDSCRRYLAEELGVDPEAETVALYELLLEGQVNDAAVTPRAQALSVTSPSVAPNPSPAAAQLPVVDWGDMPGRTAFFGRPLRIAEALTWLTREPCSLVVVSGMGGVGKTAFAGELIHRLAALPVDSDGAGHQGYARIIWRSLVNAPPLTELIDDWLRVLLHPHAERIPNTLSEKLALLFTELQSQRCLLVLDNVESILGDGDYAGRYRGEFAGYRQLIERMAYGRHRSCLLLTTRELPKEVDRLAADYPQVKVMGLTGLWPNFGAELLRARGVQGTDAELTSLVERYSGNPLALKLVATTINTLYEGVLDTFLHEETFIFEDIRDVLDEHFARLSTLECEILTWLAVARTPVRIHELRDNLVSPPAQRLLLEAIRTLRRSSLLTETVDPDFPAGDNDENHAGLALQNVVMEYVTDRLLNALFVEFEEGKVACFHRYGLRNASAPEYVQEVQRRFLLKPLAQRLLHTYGEDGLVPWLRTLLHQARQTPNLARGYIGANVFHLMRYLKISVAGEDFSQLSLRQADFRRASLIDVNLQGADLSGARFATDFGSVWSVAISPDGSQLAVGADRKIALWRMSDFRLILMLQGHTHELTSILFSHDGQYLASASFDGALSIWSTISGQLLHTMIAPTGTLQAIAFSNDGTYLAGGGDGETIWVWDWARGELIHSLAVHAIISGLLFTPTGELFATTGYAGQVQCWQRRSETAEYTLAYTFVAGEAKCMQLSLSVDATTLIVTSQDGLVYLWDCRQRVMLMSLTGHKGWVLAGAVSPDGMHFASAGVDSTIRVWNLQTGNIVQFLSGHRGWVRALAYSTEGRYLVSGGYDQTVRIWDTHSGLEYERLQGYLRWVKHLVYSPDSRYLAGATLAGDVYLWQARDGSALHTLVGHDSSVRAVAFSPDCQKLATGSDDGRVHLWDVQTGKQLQALSGHHSFVRSLAFDRSGKYLASGSLDRTIRIWNVQLGVVQRVIPNASANLMSALLFSPHRDLLAYGDFDGHLNLMEVASGRLLCRITLSAPVNVLAFSKNNHYLACGAQDGSVTLWQLIEVHGEVMATERVRIHTANKRAWRLIFSQDDKYLVWNHEGMDLHVLQVATGEVNYRIPGNHIAFCIKHGVQEDRPRSRAHYHPNPQLHAPPIHRAVHSTQGRSARSYVSVQPSPLPSSVPMPIHVSHAQPFDGQQLITDGPGNSVVTYDLATGELRTRLEGHASMVNSLDLSPDGSTLASSDSSGIVQLWDLPTGVSRATIRLQGPYRGMNITGVTGLTQGQFQSLLSLGAIVDSSPYGAVV